MSDNPLRDCLNDRRWNHGDLGEVVLMVRHRGAPRDERTVPGHAVREIGPHGLSLDPIHASPLDEDHPEADEPEDDVLFVPWHRVLWVTLGDTMLWSRS